MRALLDGEYPLASRLIGRVLPQRVDASFEEVVVGAVLQGTGRFDVVEQLPKLLYLDNRNCKTLHNSHTICMYCMHFIIRRMSSHTRCI